MNLTECGINPEGKKVLANEAFIARAKELGKQRTAMVSCMTCFNAVQRWYGSDGLTAQVGREIDRVGGKWYGRYGADMPDGSLLENEFRAIQLLIEAHREEFDAALAALNATEPLAELRKRRRAKERYGA